MPDFIKEINENSLEYGSIPFWSWNDKLDPERLRLQIREMKELKMNGFFMHARGGLETEYLSEDWYDCIKASIDEGKKLGMQAWAYDENGWPSGFAGGKLLEDKANFAVYLDFKIENMFYEDALAVYVMKNNIPSRVNAPVDACVEYLTIWQKHDESYVDTMDIEITKKFLDLTYQQYKDELGEDFGKAMPGFFTDEPQYYRWGTTWSLKMPYEFEKNYGYSVFENLCALFIDFEGADEFRYDYWSLCHKLFTNHFIKPIYEWCEKNNCMLTGHAVEETTLSCQMWCCGGVMPFYEYEHIPGIDYLGRSVGNDISPKQVGSVAAQLGKKKVLSEMFACCGWDVSPRELKKIAEYQYAGGVNLMCQHLYPYSERGQRKRDYPAHFSEHLPWHSKLKDFNEYFNRLGYVLSRGEESVNTLVIHPMHSAYLKYKRKEDSASIAELEKGFVDITNLLSQNQIAYHYGDETLMAKYASVNGKKLKIGLCEYDYVVIPLTYTIDKSTSELLKEYIKNGGKVYIYAEKPSRIDGRIADMSWLQANTSFDEIKASAEITASIKGENVPSLRCMIKNTEKGKIFYILNLSDEKLNDVEITINKAENISILDLNSLEYRAVKTEKDSKSISFKLDFEPVESYILTDKKIKETNSIQNEGNALKLNSELKFAKLPENAMTLDYAELSYDGVNFEKKRPIVLINDLLLRSRYKGKIYLKYSFDIKDIPEFINMALEPLKYGKITLNGNSITIDKDKYWLDFSFITSDISKLVKQGVNELVAEIDYFQNDYVYYVLYGGVSESLRNCLNFDTEIESIYLFGNFEVKTNLENFVPEHRNSTSYDGEFLIVKQRPQVNMNNVVIDGYPFFAGCMELESVYMYDGSNETELYLNGRYAVAEIYVNGVFAANLMFVTHCNLAEYLKVGENIITIKLYNSNRNLLGPHHFADPEPYGVGPHVFSFENAWNDEKCPHYKDRYAFVRFGIDF